MKRPLFRLLQILSILCEDWRPLSPSTIGKEPSQTFTVFAPSPFNYPWLPIKEDRHSSRQVLLFSAAEGGAEVVASVPF